MILFVMLEKKTQDDQIYDLEATGVSLRMLSAGFYTSRGRVWEGAGATKLRVYKMADTSKRKTR